MRLHLSHLTIALILVATCVWTASTEAADMVKIVPERAANQHGLARPWTAQVRSGRGLGELENVVFYRDTLYAQTSSGIIQALEAESGATLWVKQVGNPRHPTLRPGAHGDYLGVINGSQLYVLNRHNGDLLYQTETSGAPGAGPALSDHWAYVPMVSGMMVAYRLEPLTDPLMELGVLAEEPTEVERLEREARRRENIRIDQQYRRPLVTKSAGRIMVQPLTTRQTDQVEYVAWATNRDHLNVGYIDPDTKDNLSVIFRIEAEGPIESTPAYLPPAPHDDKSDGIIFFTSADGHVYAVDQRSGELSWRFSTGEPIVEGPALVFPHLFVCNQLGGMQCLDAMTGRPLWWAPRIERFLSASEKMVYAVDVRGNLVSIDRATGAWIDTLPLPPLEMKVKNQQTDRIYLAGRHGLVQCLHEMGVQEPILHNQPEQFGENGEQDEPAEPEQQPQPQQPQPQPQPDRDEPAGEDPFGAADPFGAGGGDAGGAGADDPFGAGGGDAGAGADDPFSGGGGDAGGGAADPFGADAGGGGGGAADPFGGGAGGGGGADPFGGGNDPFGG